MKIAFLLALVVFLGPDVMAQSAPIDALFPGGDNAISEVEGIQTDAADEKLLLDYIPRLIEIFIKFVAPIILIVLVLAGIKMIISGDKQEEVEKGKKTLLYTFVGAVLMLLSYSIIRAVYYFFVT